MICPVCSSGNVDVGEFMPDAPAFKGSGLKEIHCHDCDSCRLEQNSVNQYLGNNKPVCIICGAPTFGAKFCGVNCRVANHRAKKKKEAKDKL